MSNIQEWVDEFFDSMSRDEFIALLQQAGFEVEDGEGIVIFTEPT